MVSTSYAGRMSLASIPTRSAIRSVSVNTLLVPHAMSSNNWVCTVRIPIR
jgi:hypothetical protein